MVDEISAQHAAAKIKSVAGFLDVGVYKRNQTFRMYESCKQKDKQPFKQVTRGTRHYPHLPKYFAHQTKEIRHSLELLQRTLVSDVERCNALPETFKPKNEFVGGMYGENAALTSSEMSTVLQLFFGSLWSRDPFTGKTAFRVRSINGRNIYLNRGNNCRYLCPVCDTDHGGDHPFLTVFSDVVFFRCRQKLDEKQRTGKAAIFQVYQLPKSMMMTPSEREEQEEQDDASEDQQGQEQ
jgi:hypothetical protein